MQLPIRLITLSLMFGVFLGIVAIPTVAKSQSESVGYSEKFFALPPLNHFQLSEREEEWLANHPKVRIGTMNAWPPMDFVDRQGRPQGIGARFIEALNLRLNNAIEIVPGPWADIYADVKQQRLDALMGITPRPEREAFFHFTKPYATVPHAIFARNDSPYLNELADLKGRSVGVERGFFIVKVLHDNYPEVEVKEYNSTSDALDAVAKGDVDAYIGNRAVAIYIIETELISNIQQYGKINETSSINAIGVRKDWPILRDILQKALNSLTVEEMRAIMQEWVDIPKSSYALLLNNDEQRWLESKTEIRVATMDAWPPFNFVESDGTPTGIGSDIVAALNLRLEGKLKVVPGAWKEIYDKVKEGRIDAIMDITPKSEREEFFNFTKPYLDVPHVIVAPSDATYITNEDGLEGKILALEKGFGNVKYFKQHYPNVTIKEYRDTAHALGAVVRGEANAYAGNRGVALYLIENELMTNLRIHGRLRKSGSILALGTRKDWPILRDILQKALDDITHMEYRIILGKWVSPEKGVSPVINLSLSEKQWLKEHSVIRTASDRNWAPVEYVDEEGNYRGISADYMKRLEELLGVRFEVAKDLNWQESIAAFKRGELDIITSLRRTPERETYIDFSDVYTNFPIAIFSGPEVAYIGDLKKLNGRRVGVVEGYATQELLATNYPEIELVTASNSVEALEQLSRGEVDAYVGNILVTSYYIGKLGYTHIKVVGETPYRYEQSMGVRKDWPIFISILNKALNAIPETEKSAIYNRWIGVRYEYGFDYTLLWKVLAVVLVLFAIFTYWNRKLAVLNEQLVVAHNQEEHARHAAEQARITVEHANEKLKAVDKLKSMFIASMSHELRTPLNSIIGFSGLLLQGVAGDLNEKQKDSMQRINRAGNHLLGLISDVIDISKIEAGRIDAYPEQFPLKEVVEDAVESIRPQADAKALKLEINADGWPEVMTDRKRLMQCLLNYLSNSVKFTEQGKVTLTVSVKGDRVEISVTDTGIGIAEENLPKLFEAFERLETHLRVKEGGTGLGLYLTKKIAEELLHGSVSVESRINEGSTFRLEIPVNA